MQQFLRQFLKCERGVAAAEYALLIAVIGVALGGATVQLGSVITEALVGTAEIIDSSDDSTN